MRSVPNFIADEVDVAENGTNTYKITIKPRDCAHNLDELQIASASPSDYVLTREQAAGIPPKGEFTIDFDGETTGKRNSHYLKHYIGK